MWRWFRSRSAAAKDTSSPRTPGTPAPIHDHRTQPQSALPQHLQAWLLTGIAFAMMVIITWSTHSSPSRVRIPALDRPVEPNQARIEEYQRRLDEETQRLQAEKRELDQLRAAHPGATGPRTSRDAGNVERAPANAERERTLHADNIAFTRRREGAGATATPGKPLPTTDHTAASTASPAPAPAATDVLPEGTLMEAVLLNRLDGTFAGPVMCLVSVPVYARGSERMLVPDGTRALGESKPVTTFGQSRLAMTFHRLLFPDGRRVSLDSAEGLTALGEAGLTDRIDHHYAQMFGASIALGLLSGFAQFGTRTGLDESFADAYRQSAGASVAQSSLRILDRFTNILPTVTIREGHRLRIYLTKDVSVPQSTRKEP
jgi:type IV secretory pathway VirB10-like protein